jgi:hypothetical protein
MCPRHSPISHALARYRPQDDTEAADIERARAIVAAAGDPWLRSIPLHLTASALIVHPDSGRVLLRWHQPGFRSAATAIRVRATRSPSR